ncbi:beta-lactamase-like protein [Mycena crocata]|nr:beta-lactamase-like protein [Mycena crocata]
MLFQSLSLLFLAGKSYASVRDFGIPPSDSVVDVKVFNVGSVTMPGIVYGLILPALPGHETGHFPMYSFLIEHKNSQKRLMFDIGMRMDIENFAPSIAGIFSTGLFEADPKDITEILEEGGIPLDSIDTVIWSHSHFDHTGDISKFPNTTGLVIGQGTDKATYPEVPEAALVASDFAGRDVTELDFDASDLTFSGLKAIDYLGDGSLYLLNTPGHHVGHISALARVTPTTFIALGGDTFHHVGEARPRPEFQKNFPCPSELLEETKSSVSTDYFWSPGSSEGAFDLKSRSQQLLAISDLEVSLHADPVKTQVSVEKFATFDAHPDFFVLIAHDLSLESSIPYFPESLSDWKASGLKEKTVWNFLNKTNPAFVFSPVNQTA